MADVIVKVKIFDDGFEANVKKEIRAGIKEVVEEVDEVIEVMAVRVFFNSMREQPQYVSLAMGELRGELGVLTETLNAFMDEAEQILRNTCKVKYVSHAGSNDLGGLSVTFENLVDALENANNADFMSEGNIRRDRGPAPVYWLRWLLRYQLRMAVEGFEYMPLRGRGRTGGGLMIESDDDYFPTEAGTRDDNWITQAANTARRLILEEAGELIRDRLNQR